MGVEGRTLGDCGVRAARDGDARRASPAAAAATRRRLPLTMLSMETAQVAGEKSCDTTIESCDSRI